MQEYLEKNKYDVIVCTHLFAAEILTKLKNKGGKIPQTVFVATDYTCYPFTEEIDCDYYVIASPWQIGEYIDRGIDRNKIKPLGIPVQSAFTKTIAKADAKKALGLDIKSRYVLICGGSMGSGGSDNFMEIVDAFLNNHMTSLTPIVVCGSNEKLYKKLLHRYGNKIILFGKTDKMALLMRASDLYLTKPGGLSTTEAAAVNIPLVHLPPIPGCETANAQFFSSMGMSILMDKDERTMKHITGLADNTDHCRLMIYRQQSLIPQNAADKIYQFININHSYNNDQRTNV